MLSRFKNQHGRAIADHKAIASDIKRSTGCCSIGISRKHLQAVKGRKHTGTQRGIGTAGDAHITQPRVDHRSPLKHGNQPGCTRGDRAQSRPFCLDESGHQPRGTVGAECMLKCRSECSGIARLSSCNGTGNSLAGGNS
jgi:hypothetical protein